MRFDYWVDGSLSTEYDYIVALHVAEVERRRIVWKVQNDLAFAAADLGQTALQIEEKIDELFSAFGGDWAIYVLAGATAIIDSITNDVTLPWLDTEYPPASGISLRTRIIARLTDL